MNRSFKIVCAAAVSLIAVAATGGRSAEAARCAVDGVTIGGLAATACGVAFAEDSVQDPSKNLIAAGVFAEFGVDAPWELFGASNDGEGGVVAHGGSEGAWSVDFGARPVEAFVVGVKSDDAFAVFLFDNLDPAASTYSGGYDAVLAGLFGDDAESDEVKQARRERAEAETAYGKAKKARDDAKTSKDDAKKDLDKAEKDYAAAKRAHGHGKAKDAARRYEDAKRRYDDAEKVARDADRAEKQAWNTRGLKRGHERDTAKKWEKEERKRRSHNDAQRQHGGFGDAPQIIVGTFPSTSAVAAVPVPAALPLMASAFALVGGLAWRRRRAQA